MIKRFKTPPRRADIDIEIGEAGDGDGWRDLSKLFDTAVPNTSKYAAKQLKQALHPLQIQNEPLHHENKELRGSITTRKRRKSDRKLVDLQQHEEATITNLINQAYDPSSIAANNLSEILLRLQAAKEIAEYEKDALRAALHVHQKPRNRHEPPLDLQQRKRSIQGQFDVKEKEKEKELLDKIELKEAKENNRIYQLKIKEAARAAREEAKKVRDEAKAVKAAELDAKRRDRDAAKAIQQPQSGKRKASKPAAKQQPKKRRVGGAGGGTLAEVAAPAPPPTTTRRGRAVNTPAKYR
ncbi:hypothetical protein A1F94_006191 [Pyrenophora tritici-repentis]|nr:hypothetical protein A1F94_006191 [Pyrenophora tritici-repentis]